MESSVSGFVGVPTRTSGEPRLRETGRFEDLEGDATKRKKRTRVEGGFEGFSKVVDGFLGWR